MGENQYSLKLSQDENELVFSLLGRGCQTMSTAVVQLFTTEPPHHSVWIKRMTGIVCFERDKWKRSYFIRVYCVAKHELYWEKRLSPRFVIEKPKEYLITFEEKDCMIALNFAFEAEATIFYQTVTETIANHSVRYQNKRKSFIQKNDHTSNERKEYSQIPKIVDTNTVYGGIKLLRKITKEDISMPTNFKHLNYSGWRDIVQNNNTIQFEESINEQRFVENDKMQLPSKSMPIHQIPESHKSATQQSDSTTSSTILDFQRSVPVPPPPPPPPPMELPSLNITSNSIKYPNSSTTNVSVSMKKEFDLHEELMIKMKQGLRKFDHSAEDDVKQKMPVVEKRADLENILKSRFNAMNCYSDDEESNYDSDEWEDE